MKTTEQGDIFCWQEGGRVNINICSIIYVYPTILDCTLLAKQSTRHSKCIISFDLHNNACECSCVVNVYTTTERR